MLLDRNTILSAQDQRTEDVHVPEWGGTVRVRGLTGAERDRFEESRLVRSGKKSRASLRNFRAALCAVAMVGEDGQRLFSDADVEALGEKSGSALDRVYDVAARLAGLSDADVEELEKNSESDQSDNSGLT